MDFTPIIVHTKGLSKEEIKKAVRANADKRGWSSYTYHAIEENVIKIEHENYYS